LTARMASLAAHATGTLALRRAWQKKGKKKPPNKRRRVGDAVLRCDPPRGVSIAAVAIVRGAGLVFFTHVPPPVLAGRRFLALSSGSRKGKSPMLVTHVGEGIFSAF